MDKYQFVTPESVETRIKGELKKGKEKFEGAPIGGQWTVYGSMGCGWTRKQLDYMKSKGKPYTFVDCDKKGCDDIDGYPTLIHSDGRKIVGFNQV